MKMIRTVVLFCVVLTIFACAPTTTRRSFSEGWRDSFISSKVKWEMGRDKIVQAGNMHVETWRGVVTITGRAVNDEEKAKAEEIAHNVKNVKEVKNYVDVVGIGKIEVAKEEKGEFHKPYAHDSAAVDTAAGAISETAVTDSGEKVADEAVVEKKPVKTAALPKKKKHSRVPKAAVIESPKENDDDSGSAGIVDVAGSHKAKRQNGVAYEIGKELQSKELASTKREGRSSVDEITLQAEQELKDLRAKKKSK